MYAKNLDQGKYKLLVNDMGEISQDVGYEMPVCTYNNDNNQEPLNDYFIQEIHVHKNCSVIHLTQSCNGCPKSIRINCSHFCLYDFPSTRERNLIA